MSVTARMVTIGRADPKELAGWWVKALGGEVLHDFDGWFVVVAAGTLRFGFQKVPEAKQCKNRMHVDFASEDRKADVERLVGLGATRVAEHSVPGGGFSWTVMRDPAGNEFCVS
jgi:predicted enzyme related to lactoylglutathione lyase